MAFGILVVCTANIWRSPMAERLLRAGVGTDDAVEIHSAGTAGLDGHDMDAAAARALRELGGDPVGHVARSLTLAMVADADLILTAATAHRASILQADPLAFRRTFTLREFARLGAALPAADTSDPRVLSARVAEVAGQRDRVETPPPGADEVADPFGAPWAEAQAAARQISHAVDGVLETLGLMATRLR